MKRATINPHDNRKPGESPPDSIPIIDVHGNERGHVGHHATSATAARFLQGSANPLSAKLTHVRGRIAFVEQPLPQQPAVNGHKKVVDSILSPNKPKTTYTDADLIAAMTRNTTGKPRGSSK
jgi:hypothetical protein